MSWETRVVGNPIHGRKGKKSVLERTVLGMWKLCFCPSPPRPREQKVPLSGSPEAAAGFRVNVFSPLGRGVPSQVCLPSYQLSIPRLYLCPRAKLISELLDLMGHKEPVCCWCHADTHTKPKAVLSRLLRHTTFMLFFLGNFL